VKYDLNLSKSITSLKPTSQNPLKINGISSSSLNFETTVAGQSGPGKGGDGVGWVCYVGLTVD
jgi:hypothetical protein